MANNLHKYFNIHICPSFRCPSIWLCLFASVCRFKHIKTSIKGNRVKNRQVYWTNFSPNFFNYMIFLVSLFQCFFSPKGSFFSMAVLIAFYKISYLFLSMILGVLVLGRYCSSFVSCFCNSYGYLVARVWVLWWSKPIILFQTNPQKIFWILILRLQITVG